MRTYVRPLVGLLLVSGVGAWIVAGDGEGTGPRIRFDVMTHDFGEMRSDTPAEFSWTFHNDGDAPLRILGTRPSCGCTATVLDDAPVEPGGTGSMRVTFDPAGMNGGVRKSLAVMSNDPVSGRVLLTLRATVVPVEEPRPEGAHPKIAGQSMLVGDCASCHAEPAAGRVGQDLWSAICAMCHGEDGSGTRAPSVREPSYLGSRTDDELRQAIAYGTANPSMPGFSSMMGGPLSDDQIRSLVSWMRSWNGGGNSADR